MLIFVRYMIAGLLALAALVQLNDPDPLPWIAYYSICATLVVVGARGGQPTTVIRYLSTAMIGIAVVWCLSLIYTGAASIEQLTSSQLMQGMSNEYPGNELLKELGGLLLGAISLYTLVLRTQ